MIEPSITPAMKQFHDTKQKYPDCLILFRMGDFYEMFYDDAKKASEILNITLTSRGTKTKVPLAGIPYHALDNYLAKLVENNIKVAICEQLEDPKFAKGVVKRGVTRVITPGTIIEDSILKDKNNNYIVSIFLEGSSFSLAFSDITTGEFFCMESLDIEKAVSEIRKLSVKEIVLPYSMKKNKIYSEISSDYFISIVDDYKFEYYFATTALKTHFSYVDLKTLSKEMICSSGALIDYLKTNQMNSLGNIKKITIINTSDYMMLDSSTIRNLDLIKNAVDGGTKNTLLSVLDRTSTSAGARSIKKWIVKPLINKDKILLRNASVDELYTNTILRQDLISTLKKTCDFERIISRINLGNALPRDLVSLKSGLEQVPIVKEILSQTKSKLLYKTSEIEELGDIKELLDDSIKEEPANSLKEGNIIKLGYNSDVDELRELIANSKTFIAALEEKEKERTGIKNLKIRYNRVFGYFLEVTTRNAGMVPSDYIRKQTTANSERYITEELKVLEEKILNAEEKIKDKEYELFLEVISLITKKTESIQEIALKISELDCLLSLANVAVNNNYARPDITSDFNIVLKNSRHPVIETIESNFIANDIKLNKDNFFMIITGPNMSGKSTIMRQIALNIIMAQIGGFISADEGRISITDRVFTRVGAYDDLAHGQSTFMVEMSEVASIMNNATENSFIIMDEIGRGTSTFDGVSIAWSVAEEIINNIKAKTMFATHYHVLSELSNLKGVENYNVEVKETHNDIIFLRKLHKGSTDKSYGVHVAKLAGLPKSVIKRAEEIQFKLEDKDRMKEKIKIEKKQTKDGFIEYSKIEQKKLFDVIKKN